MGAAAACAAIAAIAAGCGSSGTSTTAASTAAATSTTAAAAATTTATTQTASTPAPNAAGTTAPGAELAVGQAATVPYQPVSASQSAKPQFKLRVVVTAIEKGSLSDFNGIKLDATQKASSPVYVKATFTNIGSGDAGGSDNPAINIEGVDSTGETQQSVTFLGEFPRCEYREPPKPLSHGKSFKTCLTFLIPGGIKKAAYTSTEAYISKPVTWK